MRQPPAKCFAISFRIYVIEVNKIYIRPLRSREIISSREHFIDNAACFIVNKQVEKMKKRLRSERKAPEIVPFLADRTVPGGGREGGDIVIATLDCLIGTANLSPLTPGL